MINRTQQIESVLNQSLPQEQTHGRVWYQEAHEFCKQLSEEFNVPLEKVVGVVSALSPLKSWPVNKMITRQYLIGKKNVHTKLQVTKADAIMSGKNIEKCLGGLKTINFFKNILDPKDPDWATIDSHMLWMFQEKPSLTPKKYNQLKQSIIDYSNRVGEIGNVIQATTWVTVKRIKHIK